MIEEMNLTAVDHFRRVARNGANRLAVALHRLGDDLALLDPSAVNGACQLIQRMAGPWPTDASKAAVFKVVRQAAGKR